MSDPQEPVGLGDCYAVIADLWCSPRDVDGEEARRRANGLVGGLECRSAASAAALARFLRETAISEDAYVELFELDPKCALYLGSHVFDEPKTCAGAGVSDRNDYMIELLGVYRHFGRALSGSELPDYLPLMVEFLALTADVTDDPVRARLISEYMLPYLPPMRQRLESLGTPYVHLLDALVRLIDHDLERSAPSRAGADAASEPATTESVGPDRRCHVG